MKNVFAEQVDFLKKKFRTRIGIFEHLVGSLIWGFVIVNYTPNIYDFVYGFAPLSGFLREYISYLLFGLFLTLIGFIITYTLTKLYLSLFKDGWVV